VEVWEGVEFLVVACLLGADGEKNTAGELEVFLGYVPVVVACVAGGAATTGVAVIYTAGVLPVPVYNVVFVAADYSALDVTVVGC